MTDTLIDSFLYEAELFIEFIPRLFVALVVFTLIYLIGRIFGSGLVQVLKRSSMPEAYHSYFKKLVSGIAIFIGFVTFLNLIGYSTLAASLVAGGGLTAVMLGFAFKDIGENFLAGFFLAFSRPFNTDDVIESGGITGRVKSIHLRHTHVRTGDGCDVFIPSAQLFTKPLHNYTLDGLRRGGFTVGVDYSNDIKKALDIIHETTKATKGVLKSPGVGTSIKGFSDDFVELQAFFWINAKDQELGLARVRTNAMESCRIKLLKEGFTLSADVKSGLEISPLEVLLNKKES